MRSSSSTSAWRRSAVPREWTPDNLIFVQSYGYRADYNHRVTIEEDLALIRGMPGVVSASTISGIPLSGGGSSSQLQGIARQGLAGCPGQLLRDRRAGRRHARRQARRRTHLQQGHHPLRGRSATSSQFVPEDHHHARHGEGALQYGRGGRQAGVRLRSGNRPRSSGSSISMLGAWVDWDKLSQVVFHPMVRAPPFIRYAVRAEPGPARCADRRAREEAH